MRDVAEQLRDHAAWLDAQLPALDPESVTPWREADGPTARGDTARPPAGMGVERPREPGRRAPRLLWAAAVAATILVAVVVGIALARTRSQPSPRPPAATTSTTAPQVAATGPDSALQPMAAPDGWKVWAVSATRRAGKLGVIASYTYATGPDATTTMSVTTCPGGAGGCTDSYAVARANGTVNPDGSVTSTSPNVLSAQGTTELSGPIDHLEQVWPDGAGVSITATTGALDVPTARDLASSVQLTDVSALRQLQTEVTNQAEGLPLLAAADLPGGHVELRGEGAVRAMCMAPDVAFQTTPTVTCPSVTFLIGGSEPTAPYSASLLYGSQWVVAAASDGAGTLSFSPQTANVNQLPPPLDAHTTDVTQGATTYHFGLVFVPAGVDSIFSVMSQPGSYGGGGTDRPTIEGLAKPDAY
jgi:hypothetical protein